ncbi:hypothetical protein Emag_007243 [Eimeria magna]
MIDEAYSCQRFYFFSLLVTPLSLSPPPSVPSLSSVSPSNEDVDSIFGKEARGLLPEIESYSSSSSKIKLSLKVYHLQQLAAVPGASYLLLQQHPGVACLVQDLTASAAAAAPAAAAAAGQELSPPQLHALALCCCKLKLPANLFFFFLLDVMPLHLRFAYLFFFTSS